MKLIDLTGQKFHRLTVLRRSENNTSQGKPKWICRCDCGNIVEVGGYELKSGNTKSCGCWNRESTHDRFYKHGMKKSRLYYVWNSMKDRCYNPNNKRYKDYGGRGIRVCDEWLHDFVAFRDWAFKTGYDENAPFRQCTLDRANNDEGYFPFNCVWSTIAQQNRNKRNIVKDQVHLVNKSKMKGDNLYECYSGSS